MTAARTVDRVDLLIEALPWVAQLSGKVVVLKLGGRAMEDASLRASFAQDVVLLRYVGVRTVVVHGGGPQIDAHLERLGLESSFVGGLRVTTPETLEVVRMVLRGQVNGDVIAAINAHGPFAVGLSGQDAGLLTAARRGHAVDGRPVDVGLVGDVAAVDPSIVQLLVADGRVPVIATVAPTAGGELLNINADSAAAALATAIGAERLLMLTDVPGLLDDPADPSSLVSSVSVADLEALLPGLSAGMAPKMEACARAVRGGVSSAHVLDGRVPHAILLELLTDAGAGTMVTP